MWSWRKAGTTSPGYITERNIPKYDNYPYDNLLYVNKKCPTLGFRKLARSKYDRFTKKHVARFDHYCGWIDNAVGEENYRFFLLFLFVHISMCIYGTIVTFHLLRGEVRDRDLFNAIFFNAETGEEIEADLWVIAHYIFMKHFQLCAVFLLMAVMSVVLGLFFMFHLSIASRGMTTNEYYKWRQVHKWYKKEKSKFLRAVKEGIIKDDQAFVSEQARNTEKSSFAPVNISDGDVGCVGPVNVNADSSQVQQVSADDGDEKEEVDKIMDPGPRPKNVYDLGMVGNFGEVLFPRSLRRRNAIQKTKKI
jgi:palmitoyltransferase